MNMTDALRPIGRPAAMASAWLLIAGLCAAAPAWSAGTPAATASVPAAKASAPAARQAPPTTKAEAAAAKASAAAARKAQAEKARPIDVNSAGKAQLMTLSGIGEAEADRIVANRPYLSKAEIVTKAKVPAGVYVANKYRIMALQKGVPTGASSAASTAGNKGHTTKTQVKEKG